MAGTGRGGSPENPTFSDAHLAALATYASPREVAAGDAVYTPEDESNDLIIVLSGEVEIRDESQGHHTLIARFGPGGFVGELNLLTGQRPYTTARATADSRLLSIPGTRLRELLGRETELADLLVTAMIARRRLRIAEGDVNAPIEVLGTTQSPETLALRTFLGRNSVPHRWSDVSADAEAAERLSSVGAALDDLPVVITPNRVLRRATPEQLAEALGLSQRPGGAVLFDLAVVGGGPAGLAAGVYGASEGLDVIVLDSTGPGGQAGTSSRIENYLGFPDGISGAELTSRATIQAQRFGARISTPVQVTGISADVHGFTLTSPNGDRLASRTVVVATGAQYRRLPLENWSRLEGAGIYFAATELEAGLCAGAPVFVLGGGNSAGQAALFLAKRSTAVTIVIRRASLAESMSQYLVDRISAHDLIDAATSTVIDAVDGSDHLESITVRNLRTEAVERRPARGLFCLIGAKPVTDWMPEGVRRDDHGFVLTDVRLGVHAGEARPRLPFETSVDGLFAVGDVRLGSMKRVAAAVGEGSSVIRSVHEYLAAPSVGGLVGDARIGGSRTPADADRRTAAKSSTTPAGRPAR